MKLEIIKFNIVVVKIFICEYILLELKQFKYNFEIISK